LEKRSTTNLLNLFFWGKAGVTRRQINSTEKKGEKKEKRKKVRRPSLPFPTLKRKRGRNLKMPCKMYWPPDKTVGKSRKRLC